MSSDKDGILLFAGVIGIVGLIMVVGVLIGQLGPGAPRRVDPFREYGERMMQRDLERAREYYHTLVHHLRERPAGAAGTAPAARKQTSRRKRRNNQHGI